MGILLFVELRRSQAIKPSGIVDRAVRDRFATTSFMAFPIVKEVSKCAANVPL
jgi:hypothetical protein